MHSLAKCLDAEMNDRNGWQGEVGFIRPNLRKTNVLCVDFGVFHSTQMHDKFTDLTTDSKEQRLKGRCGEDSNNTKTIFEMYECETN